MQEFRLLARRIAWAAVLAAALSIPLQVRAAEPAQPQSAPEVKVLIATGEAQLAEGKVDEAIATLSNAVAADPMSSQAYTRLGGARLVKQEFSAAETGVCLGRLGIGGDRVAQGRDGLIDLALRKLCLAGGDQGLDVRARLGLIARGGR